MVYFDAAYLQQYLTQDKPIKVYVNGEYYDIADSSDLESKAFGIGYDNNGKPITFSYTDIQQIKSGEHILTIDQLQQKTGQVPTNDTEEENPDAGGAPDAGGEPPMDIPEEPPADDEESPNESVRKVVAQMINESKDKKETHGVKKGDFIENKDSRCEYFGSRGVIIDIDDKDTEYPMVTYRVFNYGYNFKPNQKVTKNLNHLRKIDMDG